MYGTLNECGTREPFSGDNWWRSGAMGSGVPLLPCIVRPEEIAAGAINHVMLCASPANRKALAEGQPDEIYYPATRTNAIHYGSEYIPQGAVIQLDPDLNLNSLGLNEETKIVAKALQKYGMVVGENAPVFKLFFQNILHNEILHHHPDL